MDAEEDLDAPLDPPLYLSLLRDLWFRAQRPSARTVGQLAGVSHTTVNDILNGDQRSTHETLQKIVAVLTRNEHFRFLVLNAYEQQFLGADDSVPLRPVRSPNVTVQDTIREGFSEIAAAIRTLR